jgi:hypothetical protein
MEIYDLDSGKIQAVEPSQIFGGSGYIAQNVQVDASVGSDAGTTLQSTTSTLSTGLLDIDSINSTLLTGPALKIALAESPTGNAKAVATVSGSPLGTISAFSSAKVH